MFRTYAYAYAYAREISVIQVHLEALTDQSQHSNVYLRTDVLYQSICGHDVPLMTVTSRNSDIPIANRKIVCLTGRVHPGETNASWVMKGTLDYLVSTEAEALLADHVFKIIPMLNVEGVIQGW